MSTQPRVESGTNQPNNYGRRPNSVINQLLLTASGINRINNEGRFQLGDFYQLFLKDFGDLSNKKITGGIPTSLFFMNWGLINSIIKGGAPNFGIFLSLSS